MTDIVAGFDRLYLRLSTGNRVLALDARTGAPMALGPLPVALQLRACSAFADGWRAVVDTDLRGPLATFDAGATWRAGGALRARRRRRRRRRQPRRARRRRPLPHRPARRRHLPHRPARRARTPTPGPHERARATPATTRREARRPSPLGKRPLRAAVEDGWPDSATTAVVARDGALGRVSLRDGASSPSPTTPTRSAAPPATRSASGCTASASSAASARAPTTIYAFAAAPRHAPGAPLRQAALRRRQRQRRAGHPRPLRRRRGPRGRPAADEADARWYCVRAPAGDMREIRVKGFDLGVERVVGLGDGRIAVLVPPAAASAGAALGHRRRAPATSVPLELPAEPAAPRHELKRGMWLDGFEERGPACSAAGSRRAGPSWASTITLDGKVKAGELRDDAGGGIMAGRFARRRSATAARASRPPTAG